MKRARLHLALLNGILTGDNTTDSTRYYFPIADHYVILCGFVEP